MTFDDSSRKCPVLFGGHEGRVRPWLGDTWEFKRGADPGSDRGWVKRQNMGPPARESHKFAYDSQRDRVVLFGALTFSAPVASLGDTWELAIIEQQA